MFNFFLGTGLGRSILAVGFIIVAIVGWILFSPLFIDRPVDEQFPALPSVQAQTPDAVAGGAAREDANHGEGGSDGVDGDQLPPTEQPMPAVETGPTAVASGQFSDADRVHQGTGTATVFDLSDGQRVLRFEDFRVTNGPDLVVWLTNVDDPKADKGQIATDGNWVSLGKLKGNVGAQNYDIPPDVDLAAFNHVVIWCRAFGVLFSAATLEEPA